MAENTIKHIAIIMDGNGRWATERGKPRTVGHKKGYEVFQKISEYAHQKSIEVVSFYAFSTENWARPKEEVDKLLHLMGDALSNCLSKLKKQKTRLIISGDLSPLKPAVRKKIEKVMEETKVFAPSTLNVCFNYGSKAEIVNAFNCMINDGVTNADIETVNKYLYTSELPDVDLIIRTGGEMRLSNFLLWQSAYAELYFTDTYWPDFDETEFDKAIEWFLHRKRRFGKAE